MLWYLHQQLDYNRAMDMYQGNVYQGNMYQGNVYQGNMYQGNVYQGYMYQGNTCMYRNCPPRWAENKARARVRVV